MTFIRTLITSTALFSLMVFVSLASASDYDYLAKKLDGITTLTGQFSQTMVDEKGEELDQTTGEFKILRPGYFLWKTLPPMEQLIVSNKKTLSIFDPDLDQVTVYEADKMNQTPAGILTSDATLLDEFFNIKRKNTKKSLERFELTYKNSTDADFDKLTITFKNETLHALSILDKLNQTTTIRFSDLNTQEPLQPSLFEFTPPPGVDVTFN